MKKVSLILVAILLISVLSYALPGVAFAQELTDKYTDVLTDLQKDETFDVSKYPAKTSGALPDIIQVAESNAGELFAYIYQPNEKWTPIEIRISQSIGENVAPKDYKLTLLNQNGTLSKYLVEDIQLKPTSERYYFVVQLGIYWTQNLENGNQTSTYGHSIAKLFTAYTIDGNVMYSETHEEVIEVTEKYVGQLRYLDGFYLFMHECDSHYVAFDTDRPIDTLLEADVFFVRQSYYTNEPLGIENDWFDRYGDKVSDTVTLYADETASNQTVLLGGKKHTWNRIEKVSDFVAKENLKDEAKNELKNKQWVLRFYESAVTTFYGKLYKSTDCTLVSDVTILRLKFETAGKVYNLGVVDNKQTGSGEPDNKPDDPLQWLKDVIEWCKNAANWLAEHWWVIPVGIVAIGLIIWLIIEIIRLGAKVVFKAIGKALWWLLKGIFYIVTAPVWLIVIGVRKLKEKKGG